MSGVQFLVVGEERGGRGMHVLQEVAMEKEVERVAYSSQMLGGRFPPQLIWVDLRCPWDLLSFAAVELFV